MKIEKIKSRLISINEKTNHCLLPAAIVIIATAILAIVVLINQRTSSPEASLSTNSTHDDTSQHKQELDTTTNSNKDKDERLADNAGATATLYHVESVVDGDTFKVNYEGRLTSVRIIGINTPETVDPRRSVECFGVEASNYLKSLIEHSEVVLVADETQSDRDKYDRLLRYVYKDGEDIGLKLIRDGYAYEYTYNVPYKNRDQYKSAQAEASSAERGLWASGACNVPNSQSQESTTQEPANTTPQNDTKSCNIKGNINNKGEKIYHLPGQQYYEKTKINTSAGERWFCSEEEAVAAGWRRSKV